MTTTEIICEHDGPASCPVARADRQARWEFEKQQADELCRALSGGHPMPPHREFVYSPPAKPPEHYLAPVTAFHHSDGSVSVSDCGISSLTGRGILALHHAGVTVVRTAEGPTALRVA